jgi:hypothetical protein
MGLLETELIDEFLIVVPYRREGHRTTLEHIQPDHFGLDRLCKGPSLIIVLDMLEQIFEGVDVL